MDRLLRHTHRGGTHVADDIIRATGGVGMAGLNLGEQERARLDTLVEILVEAQGIRRVRAILKENGLLRAKGPGGRSFKALVPDAQAASALIADGFREDWPHHAGISSLAALAVESWKDTDLDDRARHLFRKAHASLASGNWSRFERDVARLVEFEDEPCHPLVRERHAVLGLASRKPDRILQVLHSVDMFTPQRPTSGGSVAPAPRLMLAGSGEHDLAAELASHREDGSGPSIESDSGAATLAAVGSREDSLAVAPSDQQEQLRAQPDSLPPEEEADAAVVPLAEKRAGFASGPSATMATKKPANRGSADPATTAEEQTDPIAGPPWLSYWSSELDSLQQLASSPDPSPAGLEPLWRGRVDAGIASLDAADDAEALLRGLSTLAEIAASSRETVSERIEDDRASRRAGQDGLLHHRGNLTVSELRERMTELAAAACGDDEMSDAASSAVAEYAERDGLHVALEQAFSTLKQFEKAARIRALKAELAALEGASAELGAAPSPPIHFAVTDQPPAPRPVDDFRFSILVPGATLRLPHPAGYLRHLPELEDFGDPVARFLPADFAGGVGPLADDAHPGDRATNAAAWVIRTLLTDIVPRGATLRVDTAIRVLRDVAAIVEVATERDRCAAQTLVMTSIGLLSLAFGVSADRRRRRLSGQLVASTDRNQVREQFVAIMRTHHHEPILAHIMVEAVNAGLFGHLLDIARDLASASRTISRSWCETLGIAISSAAAPRREAAWILLSQAPGVLTAESDALELWLDKTTRRPRTRMPAAPDIRGPVWFRDVVLRLGQCDYESAKSGSPTVGVSVPTVVRREGLYLATGQSSLRVPILVRNSGQRAAAAVEVRIRPKADAVAIPERADRLYVRWLAARTMGQGALLEVPIRLDGDSRPSSLEFQWEATWSSDSAAERPSSRGSFKVTVTEDRPPNRVVNVPPEGVNGQPLDLHDQEVLGRSAQSVQRCFNSLLDELRAGNSVRALVFGRRRRGKSSICRSIALDDGVRRNYVVEANTWNSARMTSLRPAIAQLASLIRQALVVRGIECEPLTLPNERDRDALYAAWHGWIERAGSTQTGESRTRVLLLLDEFQRWLAGLDDPQDRRALLNLFRGFNDAVGGGRLEVSFILFGLQNLKRFRDDSLDFAAAVRSFEVRPFTLEETRRYVRQCLPQDHDDRVRRRLYELSGGNPFVLNLLCQAVVRSANADQRSYCVPSDIDELASSLDERIEVVFRYMLREDEEEEAPTLPQLTVLRAVASRLVELDEPSGWVELAEVQDWLTRKGVEFDEGLPAEHLAQLEEVGILEVHADGTRFALPGEAICRWLAARQERQTPLQPVTRRLDVNLVLNRYRQLKKLGDGGEGSAWLAENVEEGGHKVVLKIYPGSGEAVRDRIRREADSLTRIDSLYVVRCLGHRVDERKGGVVVLEWVNGRPLAEILEQRPAAASSILPGAELRDQVDLLAKLAEAVTAVHRVGVVHKDLKPQNIMMVEEGGIWRPKIIDFGLATPEVPTNSEAFTRSVWTWRYLAPEKRRDTMSSRRRPADIYSLGVVFLDVLLGPSPKEAAELLAQDGAQLGEKMRGLIADMLSEQPDGRPTIEQVHGRLAGVLEPEGWSEARQKGDDEFLEDQFDSALTFYRRALAEAPRNEVLTEPFGRMLGDIVEAISSAQDDVGWWHMLATASLDAVEFLDPSYWDRIFEVATARDRRRTGSAVAVPQILDALDQVRWDPRLGPVGDSLARSKLAPEVAELCFSLLAKASTGEAVRADAAADFCSRQAGRLRQSGKPLVHVENWLRRGRRLVPTLTEKLEAEYQAFAKLQAQSHSAAALPPDATEQDRKVIGKNERGHTEVQRIERFGHRLMDAYPWIYAVKRVRGDSGLAHVAPTVLAEDNLARHKIKGTPDERIIPFVLDASYTRYDGCIRMNIVLPKGTTAAQKAAAREILEGDCIHFG